MDPLSCKMFFFLHFKQILPDDTIKPRRINRRLKFGQRQKSLTGCQRMKGREEIKNANCRPNLDGGVCVRVCVRLELVVAFLRMGAVSWN